MSSDVRLAELVQTTESFLTFLKSEYQRGGEIRLMPLIDAYSTTRRELASILAAITARDLPAADATTREAISRVEKYAKALFPSWDERKLRVRGHRGIHAILLHYLMQKVGHPVRGSTLRILAADQVHTERRVRELRDLGFRISIGVTNGESTYTLESAEQDLDYAVGQLIKDKGTPTD